MPRLAGFAVVLVLCTACQPEREQVSRSSGFPETTAPSESTASSEPTASPEPTTDPTTTTPARPSYPKEARVEHGSEVYGVYVVVERGTQPTAKSEEAKASLREVGYDPSGGDIDCDRGAREQLDLEPGRDYTAVAVYFSTEADAKAFVDAYEPPVVGTARVTTLCLD